MLTKIEKHYLNRRLSNSQVKLQSDLEREKNDRKFYRSMESQRVFGSAELSGDVPKHLVKKIRLLENVLTLIKDSLTALDCDATRPMISIIRSLDVLYFEYRRFIKSLAN